jgi:hypothetical protein
MTEEEPAADAVAGALRAHHAGSAEKRQAEIIMASSFHQTPPDKSSRSPTVGADYRMFGDVGA